MQLKRHRNERGPTDAGWLKSMHTFSFGQYYDPAHMGFGPLRVINDDRVIPGAGFGTHPHSNMEIISYVLSGELAHKDSMGNGSTIKPGEVQLMSAGRGVTHSEYNASSTEGVHFLQIWIMPNKQNGKPGYQQKAFDPAEMRGKFRTVVSPDGEDGSLVVKQDARLLTGHFVEGDKVTVKTKSGRKYWLHLASGIVTVNGEEAKSGDGFSIEREKTIAITSQAESEILLFDLAE